MASTGSGKATHKNTHSLTHILTPQRMLPDASVIRAVIAVDAQGIVHAEIDSYMSPSPAWLNHIVQISRETLRAHAAAEHAAS